MSIFIHLLEMSSCQFLPFLYALTCLGSLKAAPPAAPTDFVFARSEGNDRATFEWVDNANDETLFQFEINIGNGEPFVRNGPGADVTGFTFSGFTPGSEVEFRLRSAKPLEGGDVGELEFSDWTPELSVITLDLNVFTSAATGTPRESFSYTITKDFEAESFRSVGTLPEWLNLDSTSGTFSAETPPEGSFRVNYEAEMGIHVRSGFLHINVINEKPLLNGTLDAVTIIAEPSVEIDLSTVFEDPDFIRAVSVSTEFGDIKIGFYEGFPVTVNNFFAYAESDAWDGAFFHRMAKLGNGENFVLQGGGFKPGDEPGKYSRVPQLPTIVNEFDSSRPNLCGTISMAKLGGDPDSATNQFFISLNDNRSILDGQNGGFTVFGRAAEIAPVNRMSILPRGTFQVDLDDQLISLSDWPLTSIDENSPAFDQLASMSDVFEIPTLRYSVTSDGDDVVSAAVAPTLAAPLIITPNGFPGTTQLTITATDLDGASVSTTMPVTVLSSYSGWAVQESASGPAEMSDSGVLTNFEEYAYGGDPNNSADDAGLIPFAGVDDLGHGIFTFRHRGFASDLSYLVQMSSNLINWDTIWMTDDGFDAVNITNVSDEGEIKMVTVQRSALVTDESRLFFRLVVNTGVAN